MVTGQLGEATGSKVGPEYGRAGGADLSSRLLEPPVSIAPRRQDDVDARLATTVASRTREILRPP